MTSPGGEGTSSRVNDDSKVLLHDDDGYTIIDRRKREEYRHETTNAGTSCKEKRESMLPIYYFHILYCQYHYSNNKHCKK